MPEVGSGAAGGAGVAGTAGDPITAAGTGDGADGTTLGGVGLAMRGIRTTIGMVAGILPVRNADRVADTLLTADVEALLLTQRTDGVMLSATDRRSRSDGGMPDGVLTTAITSASEITGLRARLATRTDLPEITVTRDLKVTATRIPTENTAKITVRLTTATTAKAVSNARSANLRAAVALTEVAASAVVAEVDSAAVAGADLAEADVADADKM